jgi:hypothetical protein
MHEFIKEVNTFTPKFDFNIIFRDDAHSTAIAFWIDVADELVGGSHDCCGT